MIKSIRFLTSAVLLSLSLLLSGCSGTQSSAGTTKATYLCLIVIDGCRPDYLTLTDTPNINKLISEGVSYSQAWVGQLKNVTPSSHTSISTGSFPKNTGVLGFGWNDPQNNNKSINITDWDDVTSGVFNRFITASGVTSIGTLYKKAHPGAKVAALSADKFYAAAAMGADSADCIVFDDDSATQDYARAMGGLLAPAGVAGHLAPPEIMNDPSLFHKKQESYSSDTWATDMALKLFENTKPEIMLINLPETDGYGHLTGGITNPSTMSKIISNDDKQIGRLMDAYKKAGIYDQTLFCVLADHGMSPETTVVPIDNIINIAKKSGTVISPKALQFDVSNPQKTAEVAENVAAAKIPGIIGVYYRTKLENGSYTYLPTNSTLNALPVDLNQTYEYLTSTYAGASSPGIFLAVTENTDTDFDVTQGNHNVATWNTQHIPLIISGPGVKKSAQLTSPARLVDIAPTLLTLMGIQPEHMDGVVLADALTSPTQQQVDKQQETNGQLIPMVTAFEKQSRADLAALDAQNKTKTPLILTPAK